MQVESIEPIYEGWGRFLMVTLRAGDGTLLRREMEDHGASVVVLPYDPDRGCVLLVRQPRTPLIVAGAEPLLEAPAGRLDGESPEVAARREAMEECGVRLDTLEPVGTYWGMPGVSTEHLAMYLARYRAADRVAAGGGLAEEGEAIEVVEMPVARFFALEAAGALHDLKTALLALKLKARLSAD